MNQLEKRVISYMRDALANLDTDHAAVQENMSYAHNLFAGCLMQWSEEFARLYDQMLEVYRAHTPMKRGHYRVTHIASGYSSLPIHTWVNDKEQPPIPTSSELVTRFDQIINEYQQVRQ